jgi:hypothetical protein
MPAQNLAPPNSPKTPSKSQAKVGHVLTTLGILTLTFGVLGWQWRAFSQRTSAAMSENRESDGREDLPPPNTHWHEAPPQVRLAVATCIRSQLRALGNGALNGSGFEMSLQFHTRSVRGRMRSIEEYKMLIRTYYPVLAQHQRETFRFVNTDKQRRFANAGVSIVGAEGQVMEAAYQLVFQDKQWLISGITQRPPHVLPSASKKP